MQLKFFSIPVSGESPLIDELNKFLRSNRIVSVQKELTQRDTAPCWRICVEYLDMPSGKEKNHSRQREKIDYKEVLSEKDFAVFARLREIRKKLAEKEAIPVYAVCTNEHLAQMARLRCSSLTELKEISGFGEAKAKKYGKAFLDAISQSQMDGRENEKSGKPD